MDERTLTVHLTEPSRTAVRTTVRARNRPVLAWARAAVGVLLAVILLAVDGALRPWPGRRTSPRQVFTA